MVRARRFFVGEAKVAVLYLPFARNPIHCVPTVPTSEQETSVTYSEAFTELARQVAGVRVSNPGGADGCQPKCPDASIVLALK
jgi:hypothetical protein